MFWNGGFEDVRIRGSKKMGVMGCLEDELRVVMVGGGFGG